MRGFCRSGGRQLCPWGNGWGNVRVWSHVSDGPGLTPTVTSVPTPPKHPEPFPGFAQFRDDRDAPFYASRMPAFPTPEATAAEVVARFSRVVFEVMREASRQPRRMNRADLVRWHRATFRTTFPFQAGRLREDATVFEIRWRDAGKLRKRPLSGSEAEHVPAELDAAFAAYDAELAARRPEQRTLREAVTAAAALYVELLRVHPFEDGNLRAAFPALQGALISLGATAVDFDDAVGDHDEALGWALRPDPEHRSLDPFVDLLMQRIAMAAEQRPRP
jgi:fido (protein-threonine AMPylation protein)